MAKSREETLVSSSGNGSISTGDKPTVKAVIINAVSFQIFWFVCVQGHNWLALLALVIFFAIHFMFVLRSKFEWYLLGAFCCIGLVLETLVNSFGVIRYSGSLAFSIFGMQITLAPLWILCLWAGFATMLDNGLVWMQKRLVLLPLLVILSIPGTYYLGATLSDSILMSPAIVALLVVTLVWMAVIPLGFLLVAKCKAMAALKMRNVRSGDYVSAN